MRAASRRQAANVAAARCARRDASHSDAFERLVCLHSCSVSFGVMNARRLSHLKKAGASGALEIARQGPCACSMSFRRVHPRFILVCCACSVSFLSFPLSVHSYYKLVPR